MHSILGQWIAASATSQVDIGVIVPVGTIQMNIAASFRRMLRIAF